MRVARTPCEWRGTTRTKDQVRGGAGVTAIAIGEGMYRDKPVVEPDGCFVDFIGAVSRQSEPRISNKVPHTRRHLALVSAVKMPVCSAVSRSPRVSTHDNLRPSDSSGVSGVDPSACEKRSLNLGPRGQACRATPGCALQ
ncbi:MAG: hypothetical protein RL134_573 [Actinomycetota bacterium]